MMRGITVQLFNETETGKNSFGEPIVEEQAVDVENVLVSPASAQEILDADNLYGRKAEYTLAIPKGDQHDWQNKHIRFYDKDWQSFGIPTKGIDELVPTAWNMKVMVMHHE